MSAATHQDLFCESQNACNRGTESRPNWGISDTPYHLDVVRRELASTFCVSHLATDSVCHTEESEVAALPSVILSDPERSEWESKDP
jgi:hypothetical protein